MPVYRRSQTSQDAAHYVYRCMPTTCICSCTLPDRNCDHRPRSACEMLMHMRVQSAPSCAIGQACKVQPPTPECSLDMSVCSDPLAYGSIRHCPHCTIIASPPIIASKWHSTSLEAMRYILVHLTGVPGTACEMHNASQQKLRCHGSTGNELAPVNTHL